MSLQKSTIKQDRMLPPAVVAVLRIRDRTDLVCPDEILTRLDSLKIGKVVYHFKVAVPAASSSNQMNAWRGSPRSRDTGFGGNGGGGAHGGGGRHGNDHHHNRHNSDRYGGAHGGNSPHGGGGAHGGGGGNSWGGNMGMRRVPSEHNSIHSPGEGDSTPPFRRFRGHQGNSPTTPGAGEGTPTAFPPGGRYVSSIVSDKKVEDRIIGHIRSKLNKFSLNNYDSIKSFLEQIMNSGETEFISEFMDLLFTKAASEEIYCELYARLLLELTGKFPHLRTEIKTIYENFLGIFVEARDIPDQSTADYKKFLDAQEKKKFRKGYSHFLAEIYNKGLITSEAIETAVNTIMASLDKLEKDTTNTLLVEEYIVSLNKIVLTINDAKTAPIPPYLVNLLDKLKTTVGKPKADTPGYTSKARFAIMDIVDALPN